MARREQIIYDINDIKKVKLVAQPIKQLLYVPISEHDEVWYFGLHGFLCRGKYKVAKRFGSMTFRTKKSAAKFKKLQYELFDVISNLVDKEISNSTRNNFDNFAEVSEFTGGKSNLRDASEFVNITGGYGKVPDFLTLRGSLNTSEMKLKRMIERGEIL